MLCLGRFAGLRRAEIAGVHTDHVDAGTLRVLGKGAKVRHVPLHPEIARPLGLLPPGWAFPSATYPGRPLTPAHVGVILRRVLPPGWTPHTLRHRAGSDWFAVERDLIAVQRLLGHTSLDTTRIYVDVVGDSMRRAVLGVA